MTIALQGLLIGLVGTVLVDIWAWLLKRVFGLPTTSWAMVGRWVGHLRHGQFVHRSIGRAAPVSGELSLGWAFHYIVGVLYGIGYLWFMDSALAQPPSLLTAVTFSVALLVTPWFILQPGLGLGVFARLAPRPWLTRSMSVSIHTVFGIGMYIGWWLIEKWGT